MKGKKGFTLLEIMIALAIVGGLLVTLLYTLNYHIGIAERHEVLTVASMLAKNKIVEMEQNPVTGEGAFPEPFSGYRYATKIADSSFPGIAEISVTVSSGKEDVVFRQLIEKAR